MLGEIRIHGYIGESNGGKPWPADLGGPRGTAAGEVLASLEEQAARGARALVVRLESPGGLVADGFQIADALRAWSQERGPVVVFVTGEVASVAPAVAAAADVVVMDPGATFWLHAMSGTGAAAADADLLRRLRARCHSPDLPAWLALRPNEKGEPNRAELDAPAALSWGLADCIGTVDDARRIAATLERPRLEGAVGCKLDKDGTALKVAPGNLQIGAHVFNQVFRNYSITISDTAGFGSVTFATAEPDTNYALCVNCSDSSGSPATNSFIPFRVTKYTTSFSLFLLGSPGTGSSVTYSITFIRLF